MIKHCAVAALVSLVAAASYAGDLTDRDSIERVELEQTGEIDAASALALNRPDLFNAIDGSLLIHGLPVVTLLDGRRFPISGDLARMGITPVDLFPVAFLQRVDVRPVTSSAAAGSDGPGGVVDLKLNRYYTGGEVGVFYGKSGGKYGREDFESYLTGGIGNDKFQINVGAAYRESNFSVPRGRP